MSTPGRSCSRSTPQPGSCSGTFRIEPPFPATGRGPIYGDGRIYAYGQSILYAVDAKTGRIVESFANKGRLEIARAAVQFKYPDKDPTGYQLTSSPAYFNGTLYVGLAQSEHHIPGGLVVAVDGKTGAIKWVFNTVPQGPADDGWAIAQRVRGAAARGPAAASGRRPRSIPSWDSST